MTDTIRHLIAAAGNDPDDDTPLHALADALDEAHPRGRDPRATIIRHSLNPQKGWWAYTHGRTSATHHDSHIEPNLDATSLTSYPTVHYLDTTLQTQGNAAEAGPLYTIMLGRTGWGGRQVVSGHLNLTDARNIADQFDSPHREEFHRQLDEYGPDPRPSGYSEHYSRAVRQ